MPIKKGDNGKWAIGDAPARYKTRKAAERAWGGYIKASHKSHKK